MTTEIPAIDPSAPPVDPAIAAAAAIVDPAAGDPAAAGGDPAAPEPGAGDLGPGEPKGRGGRPPKWALERISEETARAQRAEEAARLEGEGRRNAEAIIERMRAGNSAEAQPNATPRAPDNEVIETRARQIAQESLNSEKIRTVIHSGIAKFPDWEDRAAILGAAGAATPEFVLDVVAVDPVNAHQILHQLSEDSQKAAHLAKMDPRTRTIELVKMSLAAQSTAAADPKPAEPKPSIPTPRTVSKAPAPAPAIEPGAAQTVDWRSDPNISDAEFSKQWDENAKKRSAARR